jgi:hypothetical protein
MSLGKNVAGEIVAGKSVGERKPRFATTMSDAC